MLIYDLEVDVVQDRSTRPWRLSTHHVRLAVADRASLTSADNEAREMAALMCWGVRGESVDGVRITSVEL
jgi:hypothetical protein